MKRLAFCVDFSDKSPCRIELKYLSSLRVLPESVAGVDDGDIDGRFVALLDFDLLMKRKEDIPMTVVYRKVMENEKADSNVHVEH